MKTHVVGRFLDIPMVVTERRRKPRPRLPVDDDEESDHDAQADKEPLAGSRVRTGLVNVDTSTTRRRSAVVSGASRIFAFVTSRRRFRRRGFLARPLAFEAIFDRGRQGSSK